MPFAVWTGSAPGGINPAAVLEQWAMMGLLALNQPTGIDAIQRSVGAVVNVAYFPDYGQLTPAWAIFAQGRNVFLYVNGTTLPFAEGWRLAVGAVDPAFTTQSNVGQNLFIKTQWQSIYPRIKTLITPYQGAYTLNVVGYSQGGVAALLIAAQLVLDGLFTTYNYMGFASPKPFSGGTLRPQCSPQNAWVVMGVNDPIPQLPPRTTGYFLQIATFPFSVFSQAATSWKQLFPAVVIAPQGNSFVVQPDDPFWSFDPRALSRISSDHLAVPYSNHVARYYRFFRGP